MNTIQAEVKMVTKIQNLWLLEAYNFSKMRMYKKNGGVTNEKFLFHGTTSVDPFEIVKGEDGFDIRRSKGGSWGHAIYLSESALYADKFAHTNAVGEKIIIITKAAVGEIFDFSRQHQRDLKIPPIKEKTNQSMVNIKYDSVTGITRWNKNLYAIQQSHDLSNVSCTILLLMIMTL